MKLKFISVLALSTAVFAGGAYAATITNNETSVQTVKILSGDKEQSFTLNPSDQITVDQSLCGETCVLALQGGDEFEFVLADDLVLEEGGVYLNPPQQGAAGETQQNRQ